MIRKILALTLMAFFLIVTPIFAGVQFIYPKFQGFDNNGDPLSGGKLYTFAANSSTAKSVYHDKALTTPWTPYVLLDSRGEAVVYGTGSYKFVLYKADGSLIWSFDYLDGIGGYLGGNFYFPDAGQADQGVAVGSVTVKDFVDAIGATKTATIVLSRGSTGNTTDYIFLTSETIPSNINCLFEQGARIASALGITVTLYSPANIIAQPNQQIFSGAGLVAFSVADSGYAEWWGIDGVSDDVQINAALTALKKVKLLANKTYDCRLVITPPSNSVLEGNGNDTILDGSNVAGAAATCIAINGVSNVTLRKFKIDAQSGNHAGVVNNNGFGIQIYGGSTKVTLENIYLYDADYIGIYIRTNAEDVTLNNVTVEMGCYSTAILTGIHTAETGNVRNIQMDNIRLLNLYGAGIGIWSPGTGSTENININNLIVRNFGNGVLSQGVWGSTDAKNVTISNFVIDTDGGAFASHGLYFETIESWNVTNGTIINLDGGGYGINLSGDVKNSNFSNIVVKDVTTRGLIVFTTANDNNFNNITVNGSVSGGLIGGVRNIFTNMKFIGDPGATASLVHIQYSAEDLVLSNYQIHNTGAGTTGAGLEFVVASMTSATVKNGRITGTYTTPIKGDTTKVTGETASVRLRETVAAGTAYELPILFKPATQSYYVVSTLLQFSADIVQNDTNYNTYTVKRRNAVGGVLQSVTAAITTKITDGTDINAFVQQWLRVANNAYANVLGGYGLTFVKAVSGTGQAEADGLLTINYITY